METLTSQLKPGLRNSKVPIDQSRGRRRGTIIPLNPSNTWSERPESLGRTAQDVTTQDIAALAEAALPYACLEASASSNLCHGSRTTNPDRICPNLHIHLVRIEFCSPDHCRRQQCQLCDAHIQAPDSRCTPFEASHKRPLMEGPTISAIDLRQEGPWKGREKQQWTCNDQTSWRWTQEENPHSGL